MRTYLKLLTFNSIGAFFVLCAPLILATNASGAEVKLETNEASSHFDVKQAAEEERPNIEPNQSKPEEQVLDYAISAVPIERPSLPANISTDLVQLSSLSFSKLNHEGMTVQAVNALNPDSEDRKESATRKNTGDRYKFALKLPNKESLSNRYINASSSDQSVTKSNHLSAFGSSKYAQRPAESSSDVNKLLVEGDQYLAEKKYQEAGDSFDEALSRSETNKNQLGMVKALSGKTAVELGLGQYGQAQDTAVQALAMLQKVNKKYPDIEADILIREGYAYLGQEKSSDVETIVKQVSPIVEKLPASDRSAGLLVSLADLQYAIGQKDSGNQSAQKAVSFLQSNPDPTGAIAILSRLAVSQYASEKPKETLQTLQHLTDLIDKLKEQSKKISLLQSIGGLYLKLEEPEKARQSFEKAIWLTDSKESKAETGVKSLLGLGRAYLGLNRNDEAVEQAQQALEAISILEVSAGVQEAPPKRKPFFEALGCGIEKVFDRRSNCDVEDEETIALKQTDNVLKRMKRDARNIIAAARLQQGQYAESSASLREALKITRDIDNRLNSLSKTVRLVQAISGVVALAPIGFVSEVGSYINEASVGLDQLIVLPQGAASILDQINTGIANKSKVRSLDDLKKQREEARSKHDSGTEAEILLQLGSAYLGVGKYSDAGQSFKDASEIFRQINQPAKEGAALLGSGRSLYLERNYKEAQPVTQKAFDIFQREGDILGSANARLTLGNIYLSESKLSQARESLQNALDVFSSQKDDKEAQLGKANALLALSTVALKQRKYTIALQNSEEAIGLFLSLRNEPESARARLVRGSAYQALGDHRRALDDAQKALFIFKDLGDRAGEVSALNNIGDALQSQRRYEQAIKFYGLSAELQKDLQKYIAKPRNKTGSLITFFRVSSFFLPMVGTFGQVGLKIYNALSLAQNIVYLSEAANVELGSGGSYLNLGEYDQAMEAFDQARKASANNDPQKEAEALIGLSNTRLSFGKDYEMARKDAERAATLLNGIGDQIGAAYALLAQGIAHNRLGTSQPDTPKRAEHFNQAFDAFQQSIATFQDPEVLDLGGEAQAYSALADLLIDQGQAGAAITFYKKSIQITEKIRQKVPDGKLKTAYIGNIADTYRRLIELLLSQQRIIEAQQVLELLKLQEISAVGTRATIQADGTLKLTELEEQSLGQYKQFVALSQELAKCSSDCSVELRNRRSALLAQYGEYMKSIESEVKKRQNLDDKQVLDFKGLSSNAEKIVDPCKWLAKQQSSCTKTESQLKTMLIYPFLGNVEGDDQSNPKQYKLWLIWAGAEGVSVAFERIVNRNEFETAVFQFYDLLSKPENLNRQKELEAVSAKLYDWLIRPLEKELDKGKVNNLVFALDRFIRYVPMSALFDDKAGKYLIQKGYKVSTVISAKETNVGDRLNAKNVTVLAMGLANALPNVRVELNGIVYKKDAKNAAAAFPGLALYDKEFTIENLQKNLEKYRILHLATHGAFVPGTTEESYLVLGSEGKLTPALIDLKLQVELTNIHLVVLSACQTGLGGTISQVDNREKAEGAEIPSLSYAFMHDDRAKAVIASLWSVNDASTARLMQLFYANLANTKEPMTKAEALRRAQLSLLSGKSAQVNADGTRSNFNIQLPPGAETNVISRDLSHPYYWAPFILIGNGL